VEQVTQQKMDLLAFLATPNAKHAQLSVEIFVLFVIL